MKEPLHSQLSGKAGARIARADQEAEGQHVRVEWIENVQLQPGGEAPILVLQFAVGLEWQDAVAIDDECIVEQEESEQAARLELTDFWTGYQHEERALPGVGVKRVLIEAEG